MELHIKPISRQSGISAETFKPGQKVRSWLYHDAAGEVQRMDCLESEAAQFHPDGLILCLWTRVVKKPAESDAEARRQALMGAEELFLAMTGAGDESELELVEQPASPDAATTSPGAQDPTFLGLIALMLERKRVLRQIPTAETGKLCYLHARSKKTITIDRPDLSMERIIALGPRLEQLLGL
ncbi:MAG: hypothetical protein SFY80_01750 [Verrucomicrobiota bacterium]|nr:hypothetical protein [Verrucomicrobiota bacterium]